MLFLIMFFWKLINVLLYIVWKNKYRFERKLIVVLFLDLFLWWVIMFVLYIYEKVVKYMFVLIFIDVNKY